MKQRYLILFSLSGLILSLDQLVKHFVNSTWQTDSQFSLIPGFLSGVLKYNNGFAFGLLQKAPQEFQQVFFIAVPAFALILIVLIFIKIQDNQMLTSVALTTIFSGAIGNLLDRIKFGFVVDFLQFHWNGKDILPPFNVADISILTGVVLMFINTLRQNRTPQINERISS
ncbi:MAG: signal peptidase II [Proteobacteria bacterium]|nr:signal peptidase II [Pseudomonadota bacterium]NBY20545.1 signal peptidase II [bacterium]